MTCEQRDLIHAYLQAISTEVDRIFNQAPSGGCWHKPSEVPTDNQKYIVHRKGAEHPFIFEPVSGKWPEWVDGWMELPAFPEKGL